VYRSFPGGQSDVFRAFRLTLLPVFIAVLIGSPGCSGEKTIPAEQVKIKGMSPGEYRDAQDFDLKPKKGRSVARPKGK
jgi:hypothetical protein